MPFSPAQTPSLFAEGCDHLRHPRRAFGPSDPALPTSESRTPRYGLQTAVIPAGAKYGLATDEWLLPQALKQAGYTTAIIGKWHLGNADQKYWPRQRGFDYQYGPLIGEIDYFTHEAEVSSTGFAITSSLWRRAIRPRCWGTTPSDSSTSRTRPSRSFYIGFQCATHAVSGTAGIPRQIQKHH